MGLVGSGRRVVVVSPHLDDGVLSLGGSLADDAASVRLVTVCAGVPDAGVAASGWDAGSGFVSAADAAEVRRNEDLAGCARLGVEPVHLPHLDGPYRDAPLSGDVVEELAAELVGATVAYLPAGIGGHPDHVRVRELALAATRRAPVADLYLYADLPYAAADPAWGTERFTAADAVAPPSGGAAGTAQGAVRRWRGPVLTALSPEAWIRKRAALLCYASQLAPLTGLFPRLMAYPGGLASEAVWRRQPATAG